MARYDGTERDTDGTMVNAYPSTDICGPIAPTSATGHRYLIVFVCRSSGYTHTYFLKKKLEAPDVLNEFLDDIKQSGTSHRRTISRY